MRKNARVAIAAIVLVVLSVSSCREQTPRLPLLPGPAPVVIIRFEMVGPSDVEPGESVQLTANAVKSDNSVENVTAKATWSPQSSPTLTVNSAGVVTGQARGEQVVQARYEGRQATLRVFVLPRGTFKLSGSVRENGVGIQNAEIRVISGTGQGLSTRSGFGGGYTLYGVAGNVRLEVTRDGYHTRQLDLDVRGHHVEAVDIVAAQPRADYRGVYTLTLTAQPCRTGDGNFPDEARRRLYTATVSQEGGNLTVKLSDANLLRVSGRGDQFSGFVDVSGVLRFTISGGTFYYYYYYAGTYDIIERLTDRTLLVVGTVTAQGTPARVTGVVDGAFNLTLKSAPPLSPFSNFCYAPAHGFEMVRR